jgi:protein-tyrosine phosphatase
MMAKHSHRVVEVDGVENFRDVGGLGAMRRGLIYRCAKTSLITTEGRATVKALGVRHAFDLRSMAEIEQHGFADLSGIGCDRTNALVFEMADMPLRPNGKPWGTLQLGYLRLYLYILDVGTSSFRTVMQHLVRNKEPMFFHCMSGKDRTGVLAMLLQLVANVPEQLIVEDYKFTEHFIGDGIGHIKTNMPPGNLFKDLNDEEMINCASATEEVMVLLLDIFKRQWGSIEQYCTSTKGIGLSAAEFADLRALLLEGQAASRSML